MLFFFAQIVSTLQKEPFQFSVCVPLINPLQSLNVSLFSGTKSYLTHFVNVLMWTWNPLFSKGASFSGEWYLKIIFCSLKAILLLNKSWMQPDKFSNYTYKTFVIPSRGNSLIANLNSVVLAPFSLWKKNFPTSLVIWVLEIQLGVAKLIGK